MSCVSAGSSREADYTGQRLLALRSARVRCSLPDSHDPLRIFGRPWAHVAGR